MLVPMGALAAAALFVPQVHKTVSHGPIQTDHNDLDCTDCHKGTQATWRQQIQANVQYTLGRRSQPVDFGHRSVASGDCMACHDRPNERHPIYRFREPRFQQAVTNIEATSCLGCHSEHANARSFVEIDFCQFCHDDLVLKNDPVDVPHAQLVADENWQSCLGCHDFHGNHVHTSPTQLASAIPASEIREYLKNKSSPYGAEKLYGAKTE